MRLHASTFWIRYWVPGGFLESCWFPVQSFLELRETGFRWRRKVAAGRQTHPQARSENTEGLFFSMDFFISGLPPWGKAPFLPLIVPQTPPSTYPSTCLSADSQSNQISNLTYHKSTFSEIYSQKYLLKVLTPLSSLWVRGPLLIQDVFSSASRFQQSLTALMLHKGETACSVLKLRQPP